MTLFKRHSLPTRNSCLLKSQYPKWPFQDSATFNLDCPCFSYLAKTQEKSSASLQMPTGRLKIGKREII